MKTLFKQGTPSLDSNEQVVNSWFANREQSAQRAVGGTLHLTTHRLLFVPNAIEDKTGGRAWSAPLGELLSVEIVERDIAHVLGGGLRRRLGITSRNGYDVFVVTGLEAAQQQLSQVIEQQ